MNNYEKEIKKFYEKIEDQSLSEQIESIKALYMFIFKSFKDDVIDDKRLAYDIAGTMQFEATAEEPYSDIAELAGELELPDSHISGDPAKMLAKLLELLGSLE